MKENEKGCFRREKLERGIVVSTLKWSFASPVSRGRSKQHLASFYFKIFRFLKSEDNRENPRKSRVFSVVLFFVNTCWHAFTKLRLQRVQRSRMGINKKYRDALARRKRNGSTGLRCFRSGCIQSFLMGRQLHSVQFFSEKLKKVLTSSHY